MFDGVIDEVRIYDRALSEQEILALYTVEPPPSSQQSVDLAQGWNLVPYLRDESLPVDVALASIAPHLVLVKDENGQIYYPGYGINTIGDLQPGQGYKIYVDQATALTFPANNVNQTRTRRSPASGVNQARTLGSPANK